METLILKFVSPKVLNELVESCMIEKGIWLEDQTQDELKIDTQDWFISSSTEQATINLWEVNQKTHRMRLKKGSSSDGFEPLDYPFAVSMIGQIGNRKNLQDYLNSLQKIYMIIIDEQKDIKNNNNV
jgi:hypothetical protein